MGADTRLVVINACYSQPQAEAIARHVPAVVGMLAPIEDHAAIAFAVAFYRALAHGEVVQQAFALGRNELEHEYAGWESLPQLVPGRADLARLTLATETPPAEWVQPSNHLCRTGRQRAGRDQPRAVRRYVGVAQGVIGEQRRACGGGGNG